jgi:hypothetical protein
LQPVGGVELEQLREDIGVETDHRPKWRRESAGRGG